MAGVIIGNMPPEVFLVHQYGEDLEVHRDFFGGAKPNKGLKFQKGDAYFQITDFVMVGRKRKYIVKPYEL